MSVFVHTFTDGFGRWHAVAPSGPRSRRQAREAIRKEVALRSTPERMAGWRCQIVLVGIDGDKSHWREP